MFLKFMNLSMQAVSVYYFQTFQVIWQKRYDKHRLDDATAWILCRNINTLLKSLHRNSGMAKLSLKWLTDQKRL